MVDKLIFFKKIIISPLFISIIFFLLLQLPVFNYGFNYRDEGYLLNNAQRINNGEIPYVDFSLAITPGAFYIQAFVLKFFGNYIITDRILYVLCVVIMLFLSSKLFKFARRLDYVFLSFLALVYTGMDSFASYNLYGVIFVLSALYLFNKLRTNNGNYIYAFLTGLIISLLFLVKQTYGVIFFLSLLFLLGFFTRRGYLLKNIYSYLTGSAILLFILILILYSKGILVPFVSNTLYFALAVKNDRLPFILTSIAFIPFFIFIASFIKKFSFRKIGIALILFVFFFFLYLLIAPTRIAYLTSFHKESTIYYFILFFTIPLTLITLFFKSKNEQKKQITIASIAAFSLFLASSFSGRDYTTVIVTAPLYIPLFIYLFIITYKRAKLPVSNIVIILLLILFTFPSIISLFKAYKNIYGIGSDKESYSSLTVKEAVLIKIPARQRNELKAIIDFIKNNTSQNDKLLCVPYCPFLNYLTDRKNASYFGFFYKFNKNDQRKVIEDLKGSKNAVILVQRPGVIEKEANYENSNVNSLKAFISENYKLIKATGNFYVYNR